MGHIEICAPSTAASPTAYLITGVPTRHRPDCSGPARQPDASDPAHRRLLAAARPARRDPELESAAVHRVRYHPSASAEDRWSHDRDRKPRSHRARLMLPGGRDVQSRRAQAAAVWTMSQRGGDAPRAPIHSPPTRRQRPRSNPSADPTRAEQTNSSRPKRPSDKALACIRWARRHDWYEPLRRRFRTNS